ncbi:O-antigen ligase family protein [Pseudogracilibacillus sp. SE30717A]|uniref:O-antigen ligase family protein n=1 Tax=Pseudogracilibacillus sp. SE30717A TaxID=3098293 RepID=UPI00300E6963
MQKTKNKIELNKKTRSNNKGIYISSIALFIYVFYIFTQRWYGFIIEESVLQIGIIAIAIILLVFKPKKNGMFTINYTKIDLFWSIAIVTILLYIIFTATIDVDVQYFMYISGLFFLLFAKADIDRFDVSFKLIKVSSIIYAFGTFFHYFFTDLFHSLTFSFVPLSVKERTLELVILGYYPGLGFGQPAMAAGPMIMGIGIILANRFREKKSMLFDTFLILILIIGLIMTGKRSIMLWGIFSFILTYYFATSKNKSTRFVKVIFGLIFSSLILYIVTSYMDFIDIFRRMIVTINNILAGQDITSGRTILYERAWDIFKDNPIFGIGWEQFIVVTSGQLLSRDLTVHNVYLQLLAETGLVGFLIVMLAMVYTYINTFRILKLILSSSIYSNKWKIALTFSFYYQTFFILYCLTENPFYNIVYLFMYFFSLSIVNSVIIDKISNSAKV